MKLENRYFVFKASDVCHEGSSLEWLKLVAERHDRKRANRGASLLECIVIEKDWPEYEAVLAMLAERVDAKEGSL